MFDSIIRTFFFRDLFTKKEKWGLAVFYILIGCICLVGYFIIACLKLFIGVLGFMNRK